MKKIYYLINIMIIISCTEKESCLTEKMKKRFVPMKIEGIILDKYNDKDNRGLTALKINSEGRVLKYPQDFNLDPNFYRDVRVGDSVYKETGSLNFKIVRDTILKIYKNKCLDSTYYR